MHEQKNIILNYYSITGNIECHITDRQADYICRCLRFAEREINFTPRGHEKREFLKIMYALLSVKNIRFITSIKPIGTDSYSIYYAETLETSLVY